MAFPVPPLDSSILAYNPYFPNGVVSGDWATYFTALQNTLVSGPVTSVNGFFGVVTLTSSNINYTATGTGAVSRTITSKLGESVSVVDYGADPTGVSDSTAAFTKAIAASGKVYVPAGTYSLTNISFTSQSFELYGDGRASILNFNTTGVGIQLTQASSQQRLTGYIHDLAFKQTTNVPAAFIRNTGYLNLLISDCYFSDTAATYCIDNYNGYGLTIQKCVFSDVTGSGIRLRDDGAVNYYSYVATIRNCDLTRLSVDGIDVEGSKCLDIVDCAIEGCGGYGILTNSNGGSGSIQSWGINISGCDFESNTLDDIKMNTDGASYWGVATLKNCGFSATPSINLGSKSKIYIESTFCSGGSSCTITGSANAEAILVNCSNFTQSGTFNYTELDNGVLRLPSAGTAATPTLNFGDTNTGLFRVSSGKIGFSSGGTQVADFSGSGFEFTTACNWFGGAVSVGTNYAGSNTIFQFGATSSGLSTMYMGIGAIAASRGGYIITVNDGRIIFKVGTTSITGAQFDAAGNWQPQFYTSSVVGGAVASAATITPTGPVFHVTGTAAISTINLPYTGFTGTIRIIADGAWSTTTAGNIGTAIIAVANQEYAFTYDGTKWYATSYGVAGGIYNGAPADPTGTTSLTAVMMGLGGAASVTPVKTGRISFTISGQMYNNTNNDGATVQLRYGTGTAPVNGAAVTGTQGGNSQTFTAAAANGSSGFSIGPIIVGLTVGTPYWFDLALQAVTGGTASVKGLTVTAHEI